MLLFIIASFKLCYIYSVIKFSIEINDEIFTLDHDEINNTTETFEYTKKNFYLCENVQDCMSCSFLIYEYANCYWDCDHNRCKTAYFQGSFSSIVDLKEIYSTCTSCDMPSIERMNKNCDLRMLEEENSNNNNDVNNDTNKIIEYSKIDFMGLLCKYNIFNKYKKGDSIFHLNITKFYRYINMYLELDYGLYSRHINLKTNKYYDIETVGVNSISIYVYTPENYDTKPFSIVYSFKLLKSDKILNIIIILISLAIVIYPILLILIFIEIYKGKMIKYGRKEIVLGVNTLIFNRIKYYPYLFKNYNKKCFFCNHVISEGKNVVQMKCKKHIYHYGCLTKWVTENMLDKTNFFCPLCQNEELHEFSRSVFSRDDNDNLLNNNNITNNSINNINIKNETEENHEISNKDLLSKDSDKDKTTNNLNKENDIISNNINIKNDIISKSTKNADNFEDKNNPESNRKLTEDYNFSMNNDIDENKNDDNIENEK